jgi:hypothetical protein
VYRAATEKELQAFRLLRSGEGLDELVWAIIYRHGPLTSARLSSLTRFDAGELESALARLVDSKRVQVAGEGETAAYQTHSLFLPMGTTAGWEAAIFDHFQAMVKTICCRLRSNRTSSSAGDTVGGSTFTIDVWPGHPLEQEVTSTLAQLREKLIDLRQRTDAFNATQGIPEQHNQVVLYVGQCLIPQGVDEND